MAHRQLSHAADRQEAEALDAADPLAAWRQEFSVPIHHASGQPVVYLAGNSLGLMPHRARAAVEQVLDNWQHLAVRGHFAPVDGWYRLDEPIAARLGALVGAREGEVAVANSLTVNLHLLLASFYRPSGRRSRILIEPHTFPSDRYAVAAQAAWHGLDPADAVVEIATAEPDHITAADLEATLDRYEGEIAVALLGGVNYYTGQVLPLAELTSTLRAAGVVVGLDLAHAAGNVPVDLAGWDVDFAAWCTYKYLNSGPGAVAALFVNQRHGSDLGLVRLAGWWGNDPDRRFAMHEEAVFVPRLGADGWKVSNPSMLAMAPVAASTELFAAVGMEQLRTKSEQLTGYLRRLVTGLPGVTVLTPDDPAQTGCQLSLRILEPGGEPRDVAALEAALADQGVVVDARDPDVVRLSPVPFSNRYADCFDAASALVSLL